MSRVLHINGTVRPDGTPWSEPVVPWSWDGAATGRADPGEEISYASDRKSGIQRHLQRPFSRRGTLWLPASDVAEIGAPLRELARAGLLLESAKTQILAGTNWDISTWTASSCTVTAGQRGPTGETTGDGQAYLLTPGGVGGNRQLANIATPTNMNVDTYIFDLWVRKPGGDGPLSIRLANPTQTNIHTTIGANWTRIQATSANRDSLLVTLLIIAPGGLAAHPSPDTSTAVVWAPGLFNAGGAAGETDMGGGSVIDLGESRIFSALNASFPWPASPWSLRYDFTPLFGATDGLAHTFWEGERGGAGGAGVYQLQKTTGNDLQLLVTERGGGTRTATTAVTWSQRAEQRLVIVSDSSGAINCYLNGTAFSNQLAAPLGLVAATPDTIEFGGQAATAMDGVMHSFELYDRALDPARLF